jgi:hypothetical protein
MSHTTLYCHKVQVKNRLHLNAPILKIFKKLKKKKKKSCYITFLYYDEHLNFPAVHLNDLKSRKKVIEFSAIKKKKKYFCHF